MKPKAKLVIISTAVILSTGVLFSLNNNEISVLGGLTDSSNNIKAKGISEKTEFLLEDTGTQVEAKTPIESRIVSKEDAYSDALSAAKKGDWRLVHLIGEDLIAKYPKDNRGYLVKAAAQVRGSHSAIDGLETYLQGLKELPFDSDLSNAALELHSEYQLGDNFEGFGQVDGPEGEQLRFVALKAAHQGKIEDAIYAKKEYIKYKQVGVHKDYEDLADYYSAAEEYQQSLNALRSSRDHRLLYPEQISDQDKDGSFEEKYMLVLSSYGYWDEIEEYYLRLADNNLEIPTIVEKTFKSLGR